MPREKVSNPSSQGVSVPTREVLDILKEVDGYLGKLKDELPPEKTQPAPQKKDAAKPPTPRTKPAQPNQATIPKAEPLHKNTQVNQTATPLSQNQEQSKQQVEKTQAWVEEHLSAISSRERRLEEQATQQEIIQTDLENQRVEISQDRNKLRREWDKLQQEKKQLELAKTQIKNEVATTDLPQQENKTNNSITNDSSADRAWLEKQKRQLKAHKRQVEHTWERVKKEKIRLDQYRKKLKLKAESLEQEAQDVAANNTPVNNDQLRSYQRQLKERVSSLKADEAVVELAKQQYSELLEQRKTLVEVKRVMIDWENEMIRRWSIHRGIGLVGGLVACMLFLLLFSHAVSDQLIDPVWRSKTVVGVTSTVIDESQYGPQWITENHQLLVSDDLLQEAIRLGTQRGVLIFNSINEMRDALNQGMSIQLQAPGRIKLEFRHTDKDLVVVVLQALGRAFVNHHTMDDRISGRPNSMRVYEASARDLQPVQDGRMIVSAMTFVISGVVVALLACIARWWFSRSVRIFDQQGITEFEQLEDPDKWPAHPAQQQHQTHIGDHSPSQDDPTPNQMSDDDLHHEDHHPQLNPREGDHAAA